LEDSHHNRKASVSLGTDSVYHLHEQHGIHKIPQLLTRCRSSPLLTIKSLLIKKI